MIVNASHLSRLGSLAALLLASRRNAASPVMVQRFLSGIAMVIGLAVILGLCAASLIIAGIYGVYRGLIAHGLEPSVALLSVTVLMVLVIVLLIALLRDKIRALREIPGAILQSEAPIVSDIKQTVSAFLDGLTGKNENRAP